MTAESTAYDVIILGAGGAGLMCAAQAARRGRRVLVLDHAKKLGGKILISGGGRCNFTNLGASPAQYVSKNPHFCKSALSRYPADSFIKLVQSHGIEFHEKKLGQLFCDRSAQSIADLLKAECDDAGVEIALECQIEQVAALAEGAVSAAPSSPTGLPLPTGLASMNHGARFRIETNRGPFSAHSVVVATGGLSIPKIGATGFGYKLAQQFGLALIERAPALDGFTFMPADQPFYEGLSGLSVDCVIGCRDSKFRENILFTHAGLSGPAALQASLHWYPGDTVSLNLLPETSAFEFFMAKKRGGSRAIVRNLLSELLPNRFADRICDAHFSSTLPLPQVSEKALQAFCDRLHAWTFIPSGTVGYNKAEVTRGGVDTDELSSKTLEAKKVPGLHFIGEVVDVTGWLGGYNFQWAWASGWAAGQVV